MLIVFFDIPATLGKETSDFEEAIIFLRSVKPKELLEILERKHVTEIAVLLYIKMLLNLIRKHSNV